MACLKLGSKSDAFHIDGNAWLCSTGLPSDVIIEIGGGAKAFLLVAKFCYDVKMEITASNVVTLRCAAEYLSMTEDYGEGNLIIQTENFLNQHILSYWPDTIKALKTFILGEDWWLRDISSLSLPLYKRFILGVSSKHMKPKRVSASLVHYATSHLPIMQNLTSSSEGDQRILIEEIVGLLPNGQKGTVPTKFLLRLLRTSTALGANSSCCVNLEKRIGAQLDDAELEDVLIPSVGHSVETLYDVDCVHRMVDHFVRAEREVINPTANYLEEERQIIIGGNNNNNGPMDDGVYRAIDIYLKAHPWLADSEKEQICRIMNCQKLSLEASTHAAQNERLPLRTIVQVLFFEQLRLRASVAGWLLASSDDDLQNLQPDISALLPPRCVLPFDDMKERVSELEKECMSMKHELEKMPSFSVKQRNASPSSSKNSATHHISINAFWNNRPPDFHNTTARFHCLKQTGRRSENRILFPYFQVFSRSTYRKEDEDEDHLLNFREETQTNFGTISQI
ncbi:BTB/POZ domain-containing protein [Senna tora]|uniref:BTB/POZ domain-containing protein n=1 Tax=Senna tora TaxID=362788 RepID=A0A834SWI4_9FABA|nr:BTB/POZ domain-containing protein [Senna tora]